MADANYAEVYAKAIAENGAGSEVLPDDTYRVKIGTVKNDTAQATQKPKVGIRLQVIEGPHSGKSTWINQTFTADNPKAVAIFLRIMRNFGVPQEAINAGLPPAQLASYIVVGSTGTAGLGHHVHGKNADDTDRKFQDIKSFTLDAASAPEASAPAAPAAPAPSLPVAPPLPTQPAVLAGKVPEPF